MNTAIALALPEQKAFDKALLRIDYAAPCWVWPGPTYKGYGKVTSWVAGKTYAYFVHRLIYRGLVGAINDGMTLDHLCRHRPCCNPDHLEPVDNRINILRGYSSSALKARQTHCFRGHPLSGENLYITTGGFRQCRICTKERARRNDASRRGRAVTS